MQNNSFKENLNDLLKEVEERFSTEEMEEVDLIINELIDEESISSQIDHPFNRKYYVYDSLSLLLQSNVGEIGRKLGLSFDIVFQDLIEKVNSNCEIDNDNLHYVESTLFRLSQIATSVAALENEYRETAMDFEDSFEESNSNFTRHLEQ